jgi:NAD(P)-dependent dehydrogenase (short-subunit alcohol dehydrogenase family)
VRLGRFGKSEEVANLALFLASDEASYVQGEGFNVDGGMTV